MDENRLCDPQPPASQGLRVRLRPAALDDRRAIYMWAAASDITASMMGPPDFPDHPPPTWEEFCADYLPHFFDGSAPELGRCFVILVDDEPVGQVNYNDLEGGSGGLRTEIDIWLRCRAVTGHGYGVEAILLLCDLLRTTFGVTEVMMQPSARNPRAIRAYEKAGFRRLDLPTAKAARLWGPSDYNDSVYMVKQLEPPDGPEDPVPPVRGAQTGRSGAKETIP